MRFMSLLGKMVGQISTVGGGISQVVAGLMMLLITVDVIGRQVFGQPTYVADELSGYFLVAITFLALGQTQKLGKHLRVDIIFSKISKRNAAVLILVTSIISLGFLIWFTWSTSISAMQTYEMGTRTQTVLRTPYWVPEMLLPVGLGVFALQMIVSVVHQARSLR